MAAMRSARFSATRLVSLKVEQCQSAIIRGKKNQDSCPKQQYAITTGILLMLLKIAVTEVHQAMVTLLCVAFFFACRSCEYSSVTRERRTKLIKIKGVRFFLKNKELHHSDKHFPLADSITITFEMQKNDERNEMVTHQRNGHPSLCPVCLWASIIQRIRSYKGTNDDTSENTVLLPNGELHKIKATDLLIKLHAACSSVAGAATPSCDTYANKSRNSAVVSAQKCLQMRPSLLYLK